MNVAVQVVVPAAAVLGDPRVFVPVISYGALKWLTAAPVAAWARRAAVRRRGEPVGQGAVGRG